MRLCTLHNYYAPVWLPETDEIMHHPYDNYYAPVWLPETDEIMHPAQLLCTRMATGN